MQTDYDYDKAGNLIRDALGWQFFYDAENHQKEVKNAQNQPIGTYLYDGEGKRIKKISNTETVIFVYDGGGQLAAEYSTQTVQTPQTSYLTPDHLGSPRVITNQFGTVTSRKDYSAFGDETFTAQRTSGLGYQPDSIRQDYTGYQKDDESGLEFAQARYYNSSHGRFTSVDPLTASATIKDPQTFNRYSYALNSPYKFTDPLGLISSSTGANGKSDDAKPYAEKCDLTCRVKGGGTLSKQDLVLLQWHVANGTALGYTYQNAIQSRQTQQQDDEKKKKELRINLQDPNNLLDADNLKATKKELSEIYNEINVEVVFTDENPNYTLSIQQDRKGFSNSEDAVGTTPANLQTKTVSNYGYVFINQATEGINSTSEGKLEAGRDSKALGKALGRAGSHEIGHFLLQQIEHSSSGVMNKSFKGDEWFSGKTRGKWQFSKEQKQLIRSKLPNKMK